MKKYDLVLNFFKNFLNRLSNRFVAKRGGEDEKDPFNYPLF